MKEQKRKRILRNTGLLTLSTILFSLLIFSCEKYQYEIPEIVGDVSFQDVLEIFESKCEVCHPRVSPPDLTPDNAYESIIDGYVNVESPEESLIYTKFEDGHQGLNTGSPEIQAILKWIEQGAQNN